MKWVRQLVKKFSALIFRIQSRFFFKINRAFRVRPSSAPFLSGDSFRSLAKHCLEVSSGYDFNPSDVKKGDAIFVSTWDLELFFKEYHPRIDSDYLLISGNGDANIRGFPNDFLLGHLKKWFTQNLIVHHPFIKGIPIGLENAERHWFGIPSLFKQLRKKKLEKEKKILFGFAIENNPIAREPALKALNQAKISQSCPRMNPKSYLKLLNRFGFVASPEGNGVDCHRTWEAMYLRTIPILIRSEFTDNFQNLPWLLINTWDEILNWDSEFLGQKYEELSRFFESPFIYFEFWKSKIQEEQILIRKE